MHKLQININDFITEQVQKGAYKMKQTEEYQELHNEYKILLEKLRSSLTEASQLILEEMVEVIVYGKIGTSHSGS